MDENSDTVNAMPLSAKTELRSEKSTVRHVYARWAPFYNATFGGLVTRYRRHVRGAVESSDAKDVLEIGVGTGERCQLGAGRSGRVRA